MQDKKHLYKKVFVIDDTVIDGVLAQQIIRGYDVAEEIVLMESAQPMLDYLHNLPVGSPGELLQLILLDLNMPIMDGWEFLEQYGQFDWKVKDQFRIFVVSSSINIKDKERALTNEYVLDYIVKPLTRETFFRINARIEQNARERIRYLSEALEKERQLNTLKSRFVSLASHEFRTPVSGILSSANLLSKYTATEDQPQRDRHIRNITSSVNILIDILNDFLSVGRIEEGKVTVRPSEFNIKEYIERITREMQSIATNGQNFSYRHEGAEMVSLDAILFRHIMINLVSNAAKFSFENSTIEIKTVNDDEQFTLSVKDQGIGIPEEDRQHLFGLFFRAANVGTVEGTGLGLYIVAKYTDMMNGKVDYKTELNKGTEFIITFPKQEYTQ